MPRDPIPKPPNEGVFSDPDFVLPSPRMDEQAREGRTPDPPRGKESREEESREDDRR